MNKILRIADISEIIEQLKKTYITFGELIPDLISEMLTILGMKTFIDFPREFLFFW